MTDNLLPNVCVLSLSPVYRISIAQWKLVISYYSVMGRILASNMSRSSSLERVHVCVTFQGERNSRCGNVGDLEIRKLSWIIRVDTMS